MVSKLTLSKKIVFFLKTMRCYIFASYWIRKCDDPLKLSVLQMIEAGAILSFQIIGWWVPKPTVKKIKA